MANDRLDRFITILLAGCAAAISVAFVYRQISPPRAPQTASPEPPRFVTNWATITAVARPLADTAAPIKIIELADFECPFCRRADSVYRQMERVFPGEVTQLFVHFPLRGHRFATPAANASECANDQGAFRRFHDLVYDKQDSLGLKSWVSFAREAGVRDTVQFARCLTIARAPFVDSGLAWAKRLNARGTPTVIVNGWLFSAPPDSATLVAAIRSALSGKPLDSAAMKSQTRPRG